MIVVHTFRSLQDTFEARASEWAFTGAILSLSLVFALNDTMFYRDSFAGLRQMVNSQIAWSVIFGVVGLVRLSVLVVNGAYSRTPHLRAVTAFLCAGVWFTMCLAFLRNGSVLVAIMPWMFVLDAYNAKRAGKEAGRSEFIQRHKKRENDELATVLHP